MCVLGFPKRTLAYYPIIAGWIAYYCYKDYREKRFSSNNNDSLTSAGINLQFLIRMISFTVFEVVIVVYVGRFFPFGQIWSSGFLTYPSLAHVFLRYSTHD